MAAQLEDLQDTVDELMELGVALANALGYVQYSNREEFLKYHKEAREVVDKLEKRIEGEDDELDRNDESQLKGGLEDYVGGCR